MTSRLLQAVAGQVSDDGLRAVLFDWDGTFADSADANHRAMSRVVEPFGVVLDRGWFMERSGVSSKEMLRTLLGDGPSEGQVSELSGRRDDFFADHREAVRPFDDALEVLAWCREHQVVVAVASGGSKPVIRAFLADWSLTFDALVCHVDVSPGKPDPEIFLLAAERLGVPADRCLVLEDSEQGMEAASRAGMPAIDVRTLR